MSSQLRLSKLKRVILILILTGLAPVTAWSQLDDSDFEEGSDAVSSSAAGSAQVPVGQDVKTSVSSDDLKAISEARKAKSEEALVRAVARVLAVDPNHLKALNALGVFYFEQGKTGLAKVIFTRALAAHPDEPALHNNLGVTHLAEGKQRLAIASFRKSLEIKPDYRIANANLGSIFVEYKDYERALSPLEAGYKAVKDDLKRGEPYAIEVANNYAVALMGAGQTSEAREIFSSIVDDNNRNSNVLLNYASLLVERIKDMDAGAKVINRLKFVAEDSKTIRRVEELEAKLKAK